VGRIVAIVLCSLAVLIGTLSLLVGALAAGVMLARDDDGYLGTGSTRLEAPGYAIRSEELDLDGGAAAEVPRDLLGKIRIEAAERDGGEVFVGLGRRAAVDAYLRGVALSEVDDDGGRPARPGQADSWPRLEDVPGGPPPAPPGAVDVWDEQASGRGTQQITWEPRSGEWVLVVMNADGTRPVDVRVAAGATVPIVDAIALIFLVTGGVLVLVGATGLVLALRPRERPEAG